MLPKYTSGGSTRMRVGGCGAGLGHWGRHPPKAESVVTRKKATARVRQVLYPHHSIAVTISSRLLEALADV